MSVYIRVDGLDPEDLDDVEARELANGIFDELRHDYGFGEKVKGVVPVLNRAAHEQLTQKESKVTNDA